MDKYIIKQSKSSKYKPLLEISKSLERYNNYKVHIRLVRERRLEYLKPVQINCPLDVYRFIKNALEDLDREIMVSILLDVSHRIIGVQEVAVGTTEYCNTSPKEIFKAALLASSSSILCAHNHPSGRCEPSKHDFKFNKNLKKAGEIIGIQIIDHIIVGENSYYSIAQKCSFSNSEESINNE